MAVSDWKSAKEMNDLDIFVPYTNLLFVRGKIDVDAPMLVELGAGVLMEKNDDRKFPSNKSSTNVCARNNRVLRKAVEHGLRLAEQSRQPAPAKANGEDGDRQGNRVQNEEHAALQQNLLLKLDSFRNFLGTPKFYTKLTLALFLHYYKKKTILEFCDS